MIFGGFIQSYKKYLYFIMAIKKATPQGSFNKHSKILHLLLLKVILPPQVSYTPKQRSYSDAVTPFIF